MSTPEFRPRRSVLYMPSSNERALEKAKTIPCDGLILDLEDAVAPDAKPSARANAVAAVTSGAYGNRELTIRINGEDSNARITEIARLSKPGRRHYVNSKEIPVVMRGRGVVIVSTSKGLMTGTRAKAEKIGGELICKVY